MSTPGSDSRKQARTRFAIAGVALPVLAAVIIFACCDRITSTGTLFHTTFAEQGLGAIFSGEFPAVRLEFLQESFSDQSLLFHIFLYLTQWLPLAGQLLFLLAICFFCALSAAKNLNLRMRSFFAGSLLFLFAAVPLFDGLTAVTPDIFAVSALLLAFGIMGGEMTEKQRLIRLSLLAFISAWSFPCPQIVLIPALLTGLLQLRKGALLTPLKPFAAGLCAMFAGLLIHPHPIDTLSMWKLHNWDRILDALSVSYDPFLTDPALLSPSGKEMLLAVPVLLIVFAALMLRIRLQEYRGRGAVSPAVTACLITAGFFTLAFFWVKSALLFAAPTGVLAFLSLGDTFLRGEQSPYKDQWKKIAWGFFAAVLLLTTLTTVLYVKTVPAVTVPVKIGEYLKKNLPEGAPVLNGNRQDFPRLYAAAPHCNWQWGTDPAFATEKDRQKMKLLIRAAHPEFSLAQRNGKVSFEADRISAKRLLGFYRTTYAVILEPDQDALNVMLQNSWQILHAVPGEGWILSVK